MKDKLYKMMNWPEIEAIVYGEQGNPSEVLGRHNVATYTLFQTFQPDAKQVKLVVEDDKNKKDGKEYVMEMADEAGFYAIAVLGKIKAPYHYVVTDIKGKTKECADPYDYAVPTDADLVKAFVNGDATNAYEYFGSHIANVVGTDGCIFRVWAPNAIRVSVVGDFNAWNGKSHPMIKDEESGIFSLFVPGIAEGTAYKYELMVKGGAVNLKMDPYAVKTVDGSAVVTAGNEYKWEDDAYLAATKKVDRQKAPVSIYQMELASLADKKGKIANKKIDELINHLKDDRYDYVELAMSGDESYSLPAGIVADELKKLINRLHKDDIGVISEWNPSFFPAYPEGMSVFDGTYLYGHLDERKRYNNAYSGFYYNYGRGEVLSYLYSNAYYWMRVFHIDGFHVEGLASMLYLDYGKYEGEWTANMYGGHENLEAIAFVKGLNDRLHKDFGKCIMTTREEGAFPKVTYPTSEDGLGFDYIWNNGFAEDLLKFVKGDGAFCDLSKLTNSLAYEYSENYIVTMSKDDVVAANEYNYRRVEDGASYMDYLPVADENKAAVKRALLSYMMARPGKKLFYKGQDGADEFTQLSKLYKENKALSSLDRNPYGFEWIKAMNTGDGVLCFMRKDEYLDHSVLVVCNFSWTDYPEYKIGIPYEGKYKMFYTSDDKKFGGKSAVAARYKGTEEEEFGGRNNSLTLKIAPMSVAYYSYTPYTEAELLKIADEKVAKYKAELEKEAKEKAKALSKAKKIDIAK